MYVKFWRIGDGWILFSTKNSIFQINRNNTTSLVIYSRDANSRYVSTSTFVSNSIHFDFQKKQRLQFELHLETRDST